MSKTIPAYPEGKNLLAGKNVLITAAAGTGIGFAVAKRCAEEGAEIIISDIHERRLGEAAERLEDVCGKRPHAFLCNVTQEDDIQSLFSNTIAAVGHIDVLMNNAGLGGTANVVDVLNHQRRAVISVFRLATCIHRSPVPPAIVGHDKSTVDQR